jgi:ABC-type sugar transport system permease subunit
VSSAQRMRGRPSRERSSSSREDQPRYRSWALVAPALVTVLLVIGVPLLLAFYFSLRRSSPAFVGPFVGFSNYAELLRNPSFRDGVATTAVFATASAALSVVFGTAIALLLATPFRGRGFVVGLFALPWLLPTVVTSTMFRTLLVSEVGIVDYFLRRVGALEAPLLSEGGSLLVAVIAIDVWRATPFVVLLLLAALQRFPADLKDAALVDGTTRRQRLTHVTLPLLLPTVLVVLLLRLLEAARVFDLFWVLTQQQLESVSTFIYTAVARSQLFFSQGNAASVVVFLTTSLFALAFIRLGGLGGEGVLRFTEIGGADDRRDAASDLRLVPASVVIVVALAPLAGVVRTSLLTPLDFATTPPMLLPPAVDLENFRFVIGDAVLRTGIVNSLVVAGITASLCVILGSLAAYGMTRLPTRLIHWAPPTLLAVAFLPQVIVLAPLFVVFRVMGLLNTYWALIIPNAAFVLPLTTWVLVGFFRELPQDVEDAARVDGASTRQVITRLVAPLAAPGLAVAAALSFVFVYNEFLFANIFTFEPPVRPVTVVLSDAIAQTLVRGYGLVSAAALVVLLVLAVLVLPLFGFVTVRPRR